VSYKDHAEREFKAAGWLDEKDEMQKLVMDNVQQLLSVFSEQGHSGLSAPYVLGIFQKLASHEPLVPLRGSDDEWSEVSPGMFQNIRCSHVFKENGQAYDINGIIWRDPDGSCCTNFESRVPVTFPYTPKKEYRDRPAVT